MRFRTTTYRKHKCNSNTILKSPINNINRLQVYSNIFRKESTLLTSLRHKNRLDHKSFYQSNVERLLHLNPQDCKNELRRLNLTKNDGTNRKLN